MIGMLEIMYLESRFQLPINMFSTFLELEHANVYNLYCDERHQGKLRSLMYPGIRKNYKE